MIATWWKRETIEDGKTDPKEPRSSVLGEAEEARVVAFPTTRAAATE
jgi:hypothetical protein